MTANQLIKNERFVKCFIYSLCCVCNLLFLTACSEVEDYANPQLRDVYTLIDQRHTDSLLAFLANEDKEIRRIAAHGLGSIPDSAHAQKLVEAIKREKNESVQEAMAFALGQTGCYSAAMNVWRYFEGKGIKTLSSAFSDAFGKCGLEAFFLQKHEENAITDQHASGLFYLARRGKLISEKLMNSILKLAENNQTTGVYAAHALSRAGFDITPAHDGIFNMVNQTENAQKKIPLIQALGKSAKLNSQILTTLFSAHAKADDQFVRLSLIRAARKAKIKPDAAWIISLQKDASHLVRELGADWLLDGDTLIHSEQVENWIQTEAFSLVKYRLHAYLLRHEADFSKRLELLKSEFVKQQDVYVQSYIIAALAEQFASIQFLEELMYTTPSILIREYAFDALVKLRSSKQFSAYREKWKTISPSQALEEHFVQLIRDAIETHDVSMISIAAIALRDTSMLFKADSKFPVKFASLDFMRKALGTLQLPRDIEAFGELLHTISFYEGKPFEGSLKPDYNNAPDWEAIASIKPLQHVEIQTESGRIEVELWPDVAPLTVAYFIKNIERGYYSDKRIHRLVPGFVIQDGCPRGDGYGGANETIRSEFSDRLFETGVLGMASAGPDTESTQWFIMQGDAPHLNGRYTAFGKVVSGLQHVLNMKHGGRIISMRVVQ
jgi:cyclophilin family peptidyl-prolyl cis-trans isomerase